MADDTPDLGVPGMPPADADLASADFAGARDGDWPAWELEDPGDEELYGPPLDSDTDPPAGWERLSVAEQRRVRGDDDSAPLAAEVLGAGFTHRHGGNGAGFAAGGPLDTMLPGPDLAAFTGAARARGLAELTDDELVGLICAARRTSSWQAGLELAAIAEIGTRRTRAGLREGEHVAEEVGAALTLTPRAAESLHGLSLGLARLPQFSALLAAGVIDQARAAVIVGELALLGDSDAAAIEDQVAPGAGAMTTGQLRRTIRSAVKKLDPEAVIRRRKKAEKEARVETWTEPAGTGALAGRDLSPADVIAASKNLDAAARWLAARGAKGTHEQLRAAAFVALLSCRALATLLPDPASGDPAAAPGDPASGDPADPAAAPGDPAAAPGDPAAGQAGWPGGLAGTVHLTLPATTWLGLSDHPGEVSGIGPLDADTCRDLAGRLAVNRAVRWHLTLVDRNGRAVAHGCARAGPGPPGAGDPASWLARIKVTTIEFGTCSHRRESPGYRPSDSLRHVVKVRSQRCGFPGCRRPAIQCDDDHTIPHYKGGKTCECNLYPLCRHHHQAKQAPGWHLSQPRPGVLVWTLPSGRRYIVTPEPYEA